MDRSMHAVSRGAPTYPIRYPAAEERAGREHVLSTGQGRGLEAVGFGKVAPRGAVGGRVVARGVVLLSGRV